MLDTSARKDAPLCLTLGANMLEDVAQCALVCMSLSMGGTHKMDPLLQLHYRNS